MADFISALDGRQMDEALLDVAEHNSEAWAVGTRNGVEVQEGDITFQNNSQYYAQLAASQITGDITDAVRWDTDQSTILTDEAKARARNNINAAPYNDVATNLNLLDNPWWGSAEVINQIGQTSWSGIINNKYTVDRWKCVSESSNNSLELRSDGIRFNFSIGSSNLFYLYQAISPTLFNRIKGKVATASVLLSNGTIISGTTTIPESGTATFLSTGSVLLGLSSSGFTVRVTLSTTIRAVKLELCSWSTLANDVPPDKGIELAKCIASTADPIDSYANSGYARSNRNLLDNPFFTVNQRNFTSVSATNNVYSVDRWKINNGGGTGGSISKTSAGYMQLTTGSTYISLQQMFGANELAGKTVTMSINDNGTIYTHSFVVPARSASDQSVSFNYKTGCNCNFFIMNSSAAYGYIFQLSIGTGYSATIRAVKLELGSYSTLINDVPPDYGEELRKCMRYFLRVKQSSNYTYFPVGFGANITSNATRISINTPVPLRDTGTVNVSFSGGVYIVGNGTLYTVTGISMSAYSVSPTGVLVGVTTQSLPTDSHTYTLSLAAGAYIDLSADL